MPPVGTFVALCDNVPALSRTAQNYVTSLLPGHLGANSLAVLYCTAAASAFAAPVVVYHMGNTVTLVLGGACYVAYLASLIHIVEPVVYAASAVIGELRTRATCCRRCSGGGAQQHHISRRLRVQASARQSCGWRSEVGSPLLATPEHAHCVCSRPLPTRPLVSLRVWRPVVSSSVHLTAE